MRYGTLYLIPAPLSDAPLEQVMPAYNQQVVAGLNHFIAEDAKLARRFLKRCGYVNLQEADIQLLNEHSKSSWLANLMEPLLNGHNVGLMSDAGCPGIADPGADVIALAHSKNIPVVPLVGPSAIVLAIMASGFNGQNFAFNGYIPIDKSARTRRLRELEAVALKQQQAQFFIETPYRNNQLLNDMLGTLLPGTRLCIARDVTAPHQSLKTKTVAEWKKQTPDLHKVPVVFGIYKG